MHKANLACLQRLNADFASHIDLALHSHICPRCHNAQVVTGKSRTWFEVCWIPLVSFFHTHLHCLATSSDMPTLSQQIPFKAKQVSAADRTDDRE